MHNLLHIMAIMTIGTVQIQGQILDQHALSSLVSILLQVYKGIYLHVGLFVCLFIYSHTWVLMGLGFNMLFRPEF